ncbi:multidrug effflux MFS transporter [Microbacterium capsulatum]|uniref:Multidrug effflux MFS transporter n=1 Tax=Microbacterium capsulatum TaxID=3041921 RepID=A0ABU0XEE1_9MICO|nr:multidrug effflux MFS transporter [Microbacterium sp. ASV81]MDQ4213079.1 multidrug effflux MFS transporter [Microbacterium sp. ASV81]
MNTASIEPHRGLTPAVLLTLALSGMLSPASIDMLLPVLPAMALEFGAGASLVQLTITTFLVGVCVGQLVFGPLSDRIGRKIPIVLGLALFLVAVASSIPLNALPLVLAARVMQGIGAGAGMVVSRAVIADLTSPSNAARSFSVFMLIVGLAPIVTPLIGSALGPVTGWRGVSAATFCFGTVALTASAMFIPRRATVPRSPHPTTASQTLLIHRLPRLNRRFLGFAGSYAFGYAAIIAIGASLPFVYQKRLGMSEMDYGLLIAMNATGMLLAGLVSALIVRRFGPIRIARAGLLTFLGTSGATATVVFGDLDPVAIVPLILIANMAFGIAMGNITALTISALPGRAGTASALQGATQYLAGGLVAPLVGLLGAQSMVPFAITFAIAAAGSLAGLLLATSRGTKTFEDLGG